MPEKKTTKAKSDDKPEEAKPAAKKAEAKEEEAPAHGTVFAGCDEEFQMPGGARMAEIEKPEEAEDE